MHQRLRYAWENDDKLMRKWPENEEKMKRKWRDNERERMSKLGSNAKWNDYGINKKMLSKLNDYDCIQKPKTYLFTFMTTEVNKSVLFHVLIPRSWLRCPKEQSLSATHYRVEKCIKTTSMQMSCRCRIIIIITQKFIIIASSKYGRTSRDSFSYFACEGFHVSHQIILLHGL